MKPTNKSISFFSFPLQVMSWQIDYKHCFQNCRLISVLFSFIVVWEGETFTHKQKITNRIFILYFEVDIVLKTNLRVFQIKAFNQMCFNDNDFEDDDEVITLSINALPATPLRPTSSSYTSKEILTQFTFAQLNLFHVLLASFNFIIHRPPLNSIVAQSNHNSFINI